MKQAIIEEFKQWILTQDYNNLKTNKKAGAYIRVSTNKQEELSPISQLKKIWEWCVHHDYFLDLNYIFVEDEGISGKSTKKRTEFQNMIGTAKIKPKPFDCLVLWKFSRFARNQEESIVYKSMLRKQCKIDVISISEPLIEGPFGSLIERIIEWMDEYYLINLSGEVTRGMTEKATKGGIVSAASYGYKIVDGQYVPDDEESKVVNLIFNKFVYDKIPMMEIARYLNELGIKTKRGKRFENRTIFYILLNPVYIGKIRWTPEGKLTREELFDNTRSIISLGTHQAIIDEDTFNKARELLAQQRKFSVPHKKTTSDPWHWLKGLIRCSDCTRTFVRSNNKFRCNGYNKGACTNSDTLNIKEVEELVLDQLKQCFTSKIKINIVENTERLKKNSNNELSIIKEQLRLNEEKLQRIKNAFECGIDTIEEYKENKKRISVEKDNLLQQLEKIKPVENSEHESTKNKIVENSKTVYEVLTNDEISMKKKYDVAHFLINKIVYDKENAHLTLYFNEL